MKPNPLNQLPDMQILLDRKPLSEAAFDTLMKVEVRQVLSLPALCQLEFADPEDALSEEAVFKPGSMLEISIRGKGRPLFTGQLTVLEHHYEPDGVQRILVRGYDRLHRLRKTQHVRHYENLTTADLFRVLAGDLGMTVEARETGPTWKHLVQFRETDLDFLIRVAEDSGLYFSLRQDTLHLHTLEGSGDPLSLAFGQTLLSAHFDLNAERACRTVHGLGWALDTVEPGKVAATRTRAGHRVEARVTPQQVGGEGERFLADEAQPTDLLEAMAQADLDRRAAGEVTFHGVAEGDPELAPGARVEISGVSRKFTGRYVLVSVRHRITPEEGFVSEMDTLPPPPRHHPWGAICTVGKVISVDDPESLGRIRVRLPGYEDVTSNWLQVMMPAAGKDKGLTALPAVEDWVVVLHPRENLNQGVVLGGLYGATPPPDTGVEDNQIRRYTFRTPQGQVIRLDDDNQAITLHNSDGSRIEMTDERVRIHASRHLVLEAPGRSVVIRGKSIDFEEA